MPAIRKPASVSTSTVKKSVAVIEPRWAFREGIRLPREGAGSRPCLREDALPEPTTPFRDGQLPLF
jgi:hypothetical protein